MPLHLEAAGITHRGTVRTNNQNCIAIGFWISQEIMEAARQFDQPLDQPFACIVADGMGGHSDGEKASLFVAKNLVRRLLTQGPSGIAASMRAVNAELYAQVREDPEGEGMGSTVVGLAANQEQLAIFNIGDSRAYKLEGPGL